MVNQNRRAGHSKGKEMERNWLMFRTINTGPGLEVGERLEWGIKLGQQDDHIWSVVCNNYKSIQQRDRIF